MNPQQFDEFMAFGDRIRVDQEERTKRMKEEKQQEEEMQREKLRKKIHMV